MPELESPQNRAQRIIAAYSAKPENVQFTPMVGFVDPEGKLTREEIAQVASMGDRCLDKYSVLVQRVLDNRGKLVTTEDGRRVPKTQAFLEKWALAAGSTKEISHNSILEQTGPGVGDRGDSPIAIEGYSALATLMYLCRENYFAFEASSSRAIPYPKDYKKIPPELAATPIGNRLAGQNDENHAIYRQLLRRALEHTVKDLPPKTKENAKEMHTLEWLAINNALDAARQVTNLTYLQRLSAHPNSALALRETVRKLRSSQVPEVCQLGEELQKTGEQAFPTMMKHTEPSGYDRQLVMKRIEAAELFGGENRIRNDVRKNTRLTGLEVSPNADVEFLTAFLAPASNQDKYTLRKEITSLSPRRRGKLFEEILGGLTLNDKPPEELNEVRVMMEMDQTVGGIIDAVRHRMAVDTVPKLRPGDGYVVPAVFEETGQAEEYVEALMQNRKSYGLVKSLGPAYERTFGQYFSSRGDIIPGFRLSIGGADFFHLAKLRASKHTHADLSGVMYDGVEMAGEKSLLFGHIILKS